MTSARMRDRHPMGGFDVIGYPATAGVWQSSRRRFVRERRCCGREPVQCRSTDRVMVHSRRLYVPADDALTQPFGRS